MISRLKDKLAENQTCIACWSTMGDAQLVGALARSSFDAIVLDMQHGFHDQASALHNLQLIALLDKSPLVRLPLHRWDLCEKVLDFGALGVIAPMINTREQAESFANSAKYPKLGSRSYAPRHAANVYGVSTPEYLHAANECTLALAQIETQQAYDNIDEILAVDGIDGVFLGPSDFAISVTGEIVPESYGAGTIDLVRQIAEKARNAGKVAAAFCLDTTIANQLQEFGYNFISITMDTSIVEAGVKARTDGLVR